MKENNKMPKINLGVYPTPLQELHNFSQFLGEGRRLFIKRDDMCGIALGGNKVRKLEYILAKALEDGCDTIITTGAAQSNHALITAACCRKLNLDVKLVLQGRGVTDNKGNLLLGNIMDVDTILVDSDNFQDVLDEIEKQKNILIQEGRKPYIIPVGGSMAEGIPGYVDSMKEAFLEGRKQGVEFSTVVSTLGSGGTYGGTILGTRLMGSKAKTVGISISYKKDYKNLIEKLVDKGCEYMNIGNPISQEDIIVREAFGKGYAIPSSEGNKAIKEMAILEGIFLDPVYTGKTLAGLIEMCQKGEIGPNENILFIHSGGAPAIFAIPMS